MKKKYKNTFWFSVAHAMKKNFILPLMTFAVSMFFYLSNFCWDKINEAKEAAEIRGQDVLKMMRDAYEVFIFDSEQAAYNPLFYIFPALLVVISILLGVLLFRFVTNKKTVNVYYSLGIKRADLYTARLVAGIIMMLAATLIPLAVSLGLNLHYFGSSVMLWRTFLFYAVHNVICVLAGLTISAAVSSCVGTVVESLGFSAVLAAFPSVVTMCVNYSVPAILNGAPGITYYDIYPSSSSYGDMHLDMTGSTMFGRIISHINLLMLNRSSFINSSSVEAMTKEAAKKWTAPSLTPYILWAVLIAAFFVFGLFMFKRRKAEICGFPGRSAVLNFVLCMIASFGAASLIIYFIAYTSQISRWIMIALVIVASFLVFVILDVILHLSFKVLKKDWKIGLVHVGLMAAFLLSLYTGFFGYSSRVPDVQSIESASISAPNALMGSYKLGNGLQSGYNSNLYYFGEDGLKDYYYVGNRSNSLVEDFKDKDDINTVREIHKAMIKAGNINEMNCDPDDYSKRATSQTIIIKYKLKNGRELIRVYNYVPLTDYPTLYTLEDTKNWNSKIKNELLNIDSENVIPIVFSAQMDKRTAVDEELTAGLARAIYNDISTLSSDKFLSSNAKYLGSVAFYVNREQREDYSIYESSEYVNATSMEDEITEEEEPLSRQETVDNLAIRDNSQGKYLALGDYSVIPITEEMTNTISFLKEHGLYEKLTDESPIVSVRVKDMGHSTDSVQARYGYGYCSPIFNAFWDDGKSKAVSKTDSTGYTYQVSNYNSGDFMPKDSMTVTDKATLEKLAANAYGYRFDLTGGYLVEFKRANGNLTIMYVPKGRIELNID
ncbi:MAG: ABC transporter permease subunit [Oscillospiraceae bacterium]|nr:ABC transporter permease subunit [Oscillospiraceae bacterium]MDD6983491.1 ABC transporter permease subunit [Oscillospiraceae bacterium]MDY4623801.1 ABC transporter permease subunit [Oscillospiraceae bacterium]